MMPPQGHLGVQLRRWETPFRGRISYRRRMRELRWPLIVLLALSGLIRPVLSIAGVYDELGPFGRPWAPLLVTVALAVGWVAAAVLARVRRPVLTLACAGFGYGLAAITLNLLLRLMLESAERIPAPGYVAIPAWNTLLGAALGAVALGLGRLRR